MALRKTPLVSGEYYHIYNRGNSKQKIFLDREDYIRFVKLLYLCNSNKNINFRTDIVEKKIDTWKFDREEKIVNIGAWVLMPNHFHIYITESSISPSSGNESKIASFMRKISTAYVKYFNAKYKRTGSLFEGKFKSTHITDDVQAKYLFSYIHLNPIKLIQKDWKDSGLRDKENALKFLNKYKWSSYLDYLGTKRNENLILDTDKFPDYFQTKDKFQLEIIDWISRRFPEVLLLEMNRREGNFVVKFKYGIANKKLPEL
jgi:putative transposase